jgi:hypothetical protein
VKTFQTSSATLAALCIAGVSSHANAATVTVPDFIAFNSNTSTDIAIDSTTPQFYYSSATDPTYTSKYDASLYTQNTGLIASSGAYGVGTVDPTLSYAPGSAQVAYKNGLEGSGYVQLAFLNSNDQEEFGFASFDGSGDLLSITYQPAAAPLPSSWTLLIAGLGVLGVMAHRRRRVAALPA